MTTPIAHAIALATEARDLAAWWENCPATSVGTDGLFETFINTIGVYPDEVAADNPDLAAAIEKVQTELGEDSDTTDLDSEFWNLVLAKLGG